MCRCLVSWWVGADGWLNGWVHLQAAAGAQREMLAIHRRIRQEVASNEQRREQRGLDFVCRREESSWKEMKLESQRMQAQKCMARCQRPKHFSSLDDNDDDSRQNLYSGTLWDVSGNAAEGSGTLWEALGRLLDGPEGSGTSPGCSRRFWDVSRTLRKALRRRSGRLWDVSRTPWEALGRLWNVPEAS